MNLAGGRAFEFESIEVGTGGNAGTTLVEVIAPTHYRGQGSRPRALAHR